MIDSQSSIATRVPELEVESGTADCRSARQTESSTTPDHRLTRRPEGGEGSEDGPPSGRTVRIPDVPIMRLTGLALVGVGVLIVLFLVYLFAFTPLTASRNQQRLTESLVGQPKTVYSLVAGRVPAEGDAVAVLDIPSLHLQQVIVAGTSAADLMKGPGLMPGTALPGSLGNSVIAGRRVTFGAPFGSLSQLRTGDKIHVADGIGKFTYRVTRTRVVGAGQRDVVDPTPDNRLTLITSNSSVIASGRLAVQATLIGRPVRVPSDLVTVPSFELGLIGDPVAGGLAVMWSFLTLIVLVGAGLALWRWRHPSLVYLFAAPVVIACGLFACESVARALPATF
jgi:sortase A